MSPASRRISSEEEKEEIRDSNDVESAVPPNGGNTNRREELHEQKQPSMLPEVTPELLKEYEEQTAAAVRCSLRSSGGVSDGDPPPYSCLHHFCPCFYEDDHREPSAICGIPFYLFMTMAILIAAVTVGTVLAVIYYDPGEGLQPPEFPPTPAPSANSTTDEGSL